MSSISDETWQLARTMFEHEGESLNQIHKRLGISKGALSKRWKSEQWVFDKNKEYVEKKTDVIIESERLAIKMNTINEHAEQIKQKDGGKALSDADKRAHKAAIDRIRREDLTFGTMEKIVKKVSDILNEGTVQDKLGMGEGRQIWSDKKIGSKELKEFSETVKNAGEGLGVIEKPSAITNNLTQNNTSNTLNISLSPEEIEIASKIVSKR